MTTVLAMFFVYCDVINEVFFLLLLLIRDTNNSFCSVYVEIYKSVYIM